MKAFFAALVASVLLTGCATFQAVPAGTPVLRVASVQERNYRQLVTVTVQFPAGDYQPAFADRDGVYYRAPAPVVLRGFGRAPATVAGGLFVPYPWTKDQRQKGWSEAPQYQVGPPLSGRIDGIDLFLISGPVSYVTIAAPRTSEAFRGAKT